jgi:hypothetical protein
MSSPTTAPIRETLLRSTRELCDRFVDHGSIEEIVACFSTSREDEIRLFEHGLPNLAPFLGRSFEGKKGMEEYFAVVSDCLSYQDMSFSDYVVDVEARVTSVRGTAKFTWKSTGKAWDEVFVYRIQLDEEGKILVYEVWADSGAAYLASIPDWLTNDIGRTAGVLWDLMPKGNMCLINFSPQ